jgi:beta-lactamase class A
MRRCTRKPRQVAALCAVGLLAAGCASVPATPSPTATQFTKSASTPARPTPDATTTQAAASPFDSLASYIAGRPGLVTAALYDARTKTTWVFHPGVLEDCASIVKVQIMGTLLEEAQSNNRPLPPAQRQLLTTMIENSNNVSATALLAQVGGASALLRFDRSAGLNHTVPHDTQPFVPGTSLPGWGLTKTTAYDQVTLIKRFAFPNSILTTSDRHLGLGLMENIEADQAWGVTGGVPGGVTVALKNGWLPLVNESTDWQVDSIGWIHGHGRNYVLAVLSSGTVGEPDGIATIEHISNTIYTELGGAAYR